MAVIAAAAAAVAYAAGGFSAAVLIAIGGCYYLVRGIPDLFISLTITPDELRYQAARRARVVARDSLTRFIHYPYEMSGRSTNLGRFMLVAYDGTHIWISRWGWGWRSRELFTELERWLASSGVEMDDRARRALARAARSYRGSR